jgi:hypothetical protein
MEIYQENKKIIWVLHLHEKMFQHFSSHIIAQFSNNYTYLSMCPCDEKHVSGE